MRVPDNWNLSKHGIISLQDPSIGYQLPKKYGLQPIKEIGNSGYPHELIGAYAIRKSTSPICCSSFIRKSVVIIDVLPSDHIIIKEGQSDLVTMINFYYNDDQWIMGYLSV